MSVILFKPKIDVAFKMLFGDRRNADILIDFLKSVLSLPEDEYERIEIADPQLKRETIDDKLGIVDVRLITKNGKTIHIEMQVVEQEELPERITYYMSKILAAQLKIGDGYDKLEKVISIVVADFEIVRNSAEYHHVFQLADLNTGKRFTDLFEVNTLELIKLPKDSDNTKKYDWMEFLRSEKEEEFEMLSERNPVIKRAYAVLKKLSEDEEARLIYEMREKALRDDESRTRTAFNKGVQQGMEAGIQTGMEIGEVKARKELVAKMRSGGMSLEDIAMFTDISVDEIAKLV